MVTQIRNFAGNSSLLLTEDYGKRLCFSLSNGNVLVLIRDYTAASNSTERFLVYESSDRAAWTLRATITPPTANTYSITATLDVNSNLHIAHISGDRRQMRYMTVTYSGFGQSAWATVGPQLGATAQYNQHDIDVSDNGEIYIAVMFNNGAGGAYGWILYTKSSGSGWVNTAQKTLHTRAYVIGAETVSVIAAGNVTLAGVVYTNVAVAIGYSETIPASGNVKAKPTDRGVLAYAYRVRPTTGLIYEANTDAGYKGAHCIGQASGSSKLRQGRIARFFRDMDDADKIILAISHAEVSRQMYAVRLSFDLGLQASTPANSINSQLTSNQLGGRSMGISYSGGSVMFLSSPLIAAFKVRTVMLYTARLTTDKATFVMQKRASYFIDGDGFITNFNVDLIASGGQRNGVSTKADVWFHINRTSTIQKFFHEYGKITGTPKSPLPATGSTTTSSNPTVSANMDFDRKFMQAQSSILFEFATNSLFTAGLISVKAFAYDVIDGTDKNDGSIIGLELPTSFALAAGQTWYMRAKNIDSFGNVGSPSVTNSFTVAHPPAAVNLSPSGNKSSAWGTNGRVDFKWEFTDPSATDAQTAYQLRIYNRNTSAQVLDTGKIASANQFASIVLDPSLKNIPLEWEISLWDSYNSQGAYSGRAQFALYDGPIINITSPSQGAVVSGPIPTVQFTVTTAAGATVKNYTVVVTQGGAVRWTSGQVNANSAASGTTFTASSPTGIYHNNQSYSIYVTATDSRDIATTSLARTITALWTPPTIPTTMPILDVSLYDDETAGYVLVQWDDSGKDPEFVSYSLQRKDDLLNQNGSVAIPGDWKEIAQIWDNDVIYTYQDYVAPSGYQVSYRVAQGVARFDDVVYSEGGAAAVGFPLSPSYWLVDPEFGGDINDAFKLFNVSAESFDDEYERETYLVVGRGRHVDIGERLGYSGSITVQVRNSGIMSAREKRLRLEQIQRAANTLYLRNPFGDVWRVSTGDIGISRIAGTGRNEFFDLTIPYEEVSV